MSIARIDSQYDTTTSKQADASYDGWSERASLRRSPLFTVVSLSRPMLLSFQTANRMRLSLRAALSETLMISILGCNDSSVMRHSVLGFAELPIKAERRDKQTSASL